MHVPMRLTIRDVQARAVGGPLATPVRTASGSVTQALLVLIDLYTEEGPVGRAYLFAYQPFALRPLRDLVLGLGETVKGQPVTPVPRVLTQPLGFVARTTRLLARARPARVFARAPSSARSPRYSTPVARPSLARWSTVDGITLVTECSPHARTGVRPASPRRRSSSGRVKSRSRG